MPRGIPNHSEDGAPPPAQARKPPQRGLWLVLSPLALLVLFAIGARMISTLPGANNPSTGYEEADIPERVEYVDAATQKQLEATVGGQLAALRHQDWAGALQFADASLRGDWTEGKFQETIQKSGFSIMPQSSRQECRKALKANRLTTMLVTVRKPDGDGAGFVYSMVREGEGWRIASCVHALDPDLAAMPPMDSALRTGQ